MTFSLHAKYDQLEVVAQRALLEEILGLYPNSNEKNKDRLVMSAIIVKGNGGVCALYLPCLLDYSCQFNNGHLSLDTCSASYRVKKPISSQVNVTGETFTEMDERVTVGHLLNARPCPVLFTYNVTSSQESPFS